MDDLEEAPLGRIVVTEFLTLDGVMSADPGQMRYGLEELLEADALLIGRVTYERLAGVWPHRDDRQGLAARLNAMPKYVVSSTLGDPVWQNTMVIGADVPWAGTALKHRVDGTILVAGGRRLVRALTEHDLVDEYRLMVVRGGVGGGPRLFPGSGRRQAFSRS